MRKYFLLVLLVFSSAIYAGDAPSGLGCPAVNPNSFPTGDGYAFYPYSNGKTYYRSTIPESIVHGGPYTAAQVRDMLKDAYASAPFDPCNPAVYRDSDGDGVPDYTEVVAGEDPFDSSQNPWARFNYNMDACASGNSAACGLVTNSPLWKIDSDGDGWSDAAELKHGGAVNSPDVFPSSYPRDKEPWYPYPGGIDPGANPGGGGENPGGGGETPGGGGGENPGGGGETPGGGGGENPGGGGDRPPFPSYSDYMKDLESKGIVPPGQIGDLSFLNSPFMYLMYQMEKDAYERQKLYKSQSSMEDFIKANVKVYSPEEYAKAFGQDALVKEMAKNNDVLSAVKDAVKSGSDAQTESLAKMLEYSKNLSESLSAGQSSMSGEITGAVSESTRELKNRIIENTAVAEEIAAAGKSQVSELNKINSSLQSADASQSQRDAARDAHLAGINSGVSRVESAVRELAGRDVVVNVPGMGDVASAVNAASASQSERDLARNAEIAALIEQGKANMQRLEALDKESARWREEALALEKARDEERNAHLAALNAKAASSADIARVESAVKEVVAKVGTVDVPGVSDVTAAVNSASASQAQRDASRDGILGSMDSKLSSVASGSDMSRIEKAIKDVGAKIGTGSGTSVDVTIDNGQVEGLLQGISDKLDGLLEGPGDGEGSLGEIDWKRPEKAESMKFELDTSEREKGILDALGGLGLGVERLDSFHPRNFTASFRLPVGGNITAIKYQTIDFNLGNPPPEVASILETIRRFINTMLRAIVSLYFVVSVWRLLWSK